MIWAWEQCAVALLIFFFPRDQQDPDALRYMLFIPWTYCEAQSRKATQAERSTLLVTWNSVSVR
ncbi:DUF6361 family protein [Sinorhizobium meliloti]|uniref:DUF6361 family protein n=1 Tax=Rhizobium meliloti TaxID=382 RepID=UPI0004808AB7